MNERQAIGTGLPTGFDELLRYVVTLDGENGPLIQDAEVRDKMADWYVRTSGLRYTGLRAISAISQGGLPGPENSIGKVVAGQTLQEVATFATEIQGQGGTLTNPDQADWGAKFQAMMLRSLGVRIEGGTDEILKNIIAERVLGLPGDIRVDRDVPFSEIPSGG